MKSFYRASAIAALLTATPISAFAANWTLNITDTGYDPVPAGATIVYGVAIGTTSATGEAASRIEFEVPQGADLIGIEGGLANCVAVPAQGEGSAVGCDIPAVAANGRVTASVSVRSEDLSGTSLTGRILDGPTNVQTTTINEGADLAVTLLGATRAQAGSIYNFAARVENRGPHESRKASLFLALPPGLSPKMVLPVGCEITGMEISCEIDGPLAVGDDRVFNFSTQVTAENAGYLPIGAVAIGDEPEDPQADNNSTDIGFDVEPGHDVFLEKERLPAGMIKKGDAVEFILTPGLAGFKPDSAGIEDILPSNYRITSVEPGEGWSCVFGDTVVCDFSGDTTAQFRSPISIKTIAETETQPIGAPPVLATNTANISAPGDLNLENNDASDGGVAIVVPYVDLEAYKERPDLGLAVVGQEYDWKLSTRNIGIVPFQGPLTFTDHFPEGLELKRITAPQGWSCSPSSGVGPMEVVCNTDTYIDNPLPVNGLSEVVTLHAEVLAEGKIFNGLTVSSSNYNYVDIDLPNNTIIDGGTTGERMGKIADLALTKKLTPGTPDVVESGEIVSFTLEVKNLAGTTAKDIVVQDHVRDLYFSDGVDGQETGITLSGAGANACTVERGGGFSSVVTCIVPELAAYDQGADGPTFSVIIDARVGSVGEKINQASSYSTSTPDPELLNNIAEASYRVTALTDVTVAKSSLPAATVPVRAGQKFSYVLTASVPDTGASPAELVTVYDTMPNGLMIIDMPEQCVGAALGSITENTTIECAFGTIESGASVSRRIDVMPLTRLVGEDITNDVRVATVTAESDLTNNTASLTNRVAAPQSDLLINKYDSVDPVPGTNETHYTLMVTNNAASDAFDVVLTDTLPTSGLAYLDTIAPGAVCTTTAVREQIGGAVVCTLPHLPARSSFSMGVVMKGAGRGHHTNHASVSSAEAEWERNRGNNSVSETTDVFDLVDLKMTKTAEQNGVPVTRVDLRETFDWVLTVENTSTNPLYWGVADQVTVRDVLNAGQELVLPAGGIRIYDGNGNPASNGEICRVTGRTVDCELGDMPHGTVTTIKIPVKLTSTSDTARANTATVSTSKFPEQEQASGDNSSTYTLDQIRAVHLHGQVWKDFNNDKLQASDEDTGKALVLVTLRGVAVHDSAPIVQTAYSDASGYYFFKDVPPGTYQVSYALPNPPAGHLPYLPGAALPTGPGEGKPFTAEGMVIADIVIPSGGAYEEVFTESTVYEGTSFPPGTLRHDLDFTVLPQPKIALDKTNSVAAFQADGTIRLVYDLTLTSFAEEELSALVLSDTLGSGFGTFTSGTPQHGEYSVQVTELLVDGAAQTARIRSDFNAASQPVVADGLSLPAGKVATAKLEFTVNPEFLLTRDSFNFANNAEVSGAGTLSGRPVADTADVTRELTPTKALVLTKALTEGWSERAAPGDTVAYSFTIQNTGNVALKDVVVTDPMTERPDWEWTSQQVIAKLAPGQTDTTSFAGTITLTQADIDGDLLLNTATASGIWGDIGGETKSLSATSSARTNLAEPGLTLVKAEVANTIQNPTTLTDTIRYSFTITNTGNTTRKNVVLTDALAGVAADPAGSWTIGEMAPGDEVTVYGTYTVNQGDIDRGQVLNTAQISSTSGDAPEVIVTASNETSTTTYPVPAQKVVKLFDNEAALATAKPGDTVTWTVSVTNEGNTTLTYAAADLVDADAAITALSPATLLPKATGTATASYVLTQADFDRGSISNQVVVTGRVPDNTLTVTTTSGNDPDVVNEDPTVTDLPQHPSIALKKTVTSDVSQPLPVGTELTYEFVIKNTGNVTLTALTLEDAAPLTFAEGALDALTPEGGLAPDATVTVSGTYRLTADDIVAGQVTNTARATGMPPGPNAEPVWDISGTDFDNNTPTETDLKRNPAIELIKELDGITSPAELAAGDEVTYKFTIRNIGNVPLSEITLTEQEGVTVTGARLTALPAVAGENEDTLSFTATYELTQDDIDAGHFLNGATVMAKGLDDTGALKSVTDTDEVDLAFVQNAAISLDKQVDTSALSNPPAKDDTLTYSFVVTNEGNVTLAVTLSDPMTEQTPRLVPDPVWEQVSLAPGASHTFQASYQLSQADLEAGRVENTATVVGVPPNGQPEVSASDTEIATFSREPLIALTKVVTSTLPELTQAGTVVTWDLTVKNVGNVALTGVVINEPLVGATPQSIIIGDLAPGASQTRSVSYQLTQDDIESGVLINQASASGSGIGSDGTVKEVSDQSGETFADDEPTELEIPLEGRIVLTKIAPAEVNAKPGETIPYRFKVENTGNAILRNIRLDDDLLVFTQPLTAPFSLNPGEALEWSAPEVGIFLGEHTLTVAELNAGTFTNTATVYGDWGDDGEGNPLVAENTSSATTKLVSAPSIDLVKTYDAAASTLSNPPAPGDELRFAMTVTNTGNVTLTGVKVTELLDGAVVLFNGTPATADQSVTLVPGESSEVFSAKYALTQADIDTGWVLNLAEATSSGGLDDKGAPIAVRDTSGPAPELDVATPVEIAQTEGLNLVKTSNFATLAKPASVDQVVTYSFTLTNTGNVTLHDVTLRDVMVVDGLEPVGDWTIATLLPGEANAVTLQGTYELQQADFDAGKVKNLADAIGETRDPTGVVPVGTVESNEAFVEFDLEQTPSLSLVKTALIRDGSGRVLTSEDAVSVGGRIEYTFTITNTGNVTLTDVYVVDDLAAVTLTGGPIASLATGEVSTVITGVQSVTLEDLRATEVVNTARVFGTAPSGKSEVSEDAEVTVDLGWPEIALEIKVEETRDLDGNGLIGPGDEVVYRFEVTNTGTLPLQDVAMDLSKLSLPLDLVCAPITLAVGETAVLSCTGNVWTVTEADAERGTIDLSGEVSGATSVGLVVTATSEAPAVTAAPQSRPLTLEKLAGVETAMIGDVVPYTIRISHLGEGVPTEARLVDTLPAGFSLRQGTARLDGETVELAVSGRRVELDPLAIEPGQTRVLTMEVLVGSSVKPGAHTNRVQLLSRTTGAPIANEATATVEILADGVLQCATVLGRVFDDTDQNGHMSKNAEERGLPNVRLIAPNGLSILTDEHGRFNVPCAALPQSIGSNFMLKLDARTLPAGYRPTTENPRVVRLTPGMITRLDFGVALAPMVRIDLAANAFKDGEMSEALEAGLHKMVVEISKRPTMLRITYTLTGTESEKAAKAGIRKVERALREIWPREGAYQLNIETRVERAGATK